MTVPFTNGVSAERGTSRLRHRWHRLRCSVIWQPYCLFDNHQLSLSRMNDLILRLPVTPSHIYQDNAIMLLTMLVHKQTTSSKSIWSKNICQGRPRAIMSKPAMCVHSLGTGWLYGRTCWNIDLAHKSKNNIFKSLNWVECLQKRTYKHETYRFWPKTSRVAKGKVDIATKWQNCVLRQRFRGSRCLIDWVKLTLASERFAGSGLATNSTRLLSPKGS